MVANLQQPVQVSVHVRIHRLEIGQCDLLLQDHLVERHNKESVQETTMENGQSDNTSNEFEIVQMFRVDARMRVDLEGIVVMSRVLKQAIERIEHFVREQEEEFSIKVKNKELATDSRRRHTHTHTSTVHCRPASTLKDHHSQDHLRLQT